MADAEQTQDGPWSLSRVFAREEDKIAYTPREIRGEMGVTFMVVMSISVGLTLLTWYLRIEQFSSALRTLGHDNADFIAAARRILIDGGGWISLLVSLLAIVMMWAYWQDFTNHVLVQNSKAIATEFSPRQQRVMQEIHDPPGDVFTLIGIAFTFVGLALSVVSIPAEVIGQILSPAETLAPVKSGAPTSADLGLKLSAAAIVFGSSLAVGLIASLQGVMLSLCARVAAASYASAVSSSSEISTHLGKLPAISDAIHRLVALLSRREAVSATPPPPVPPPPTPPSSAGPKPRTRARRNNP